MALTVLANITERYSGVETWIYDTFIAQGVAELARTMRAELLPLLPHGGSVLDVGSGGGQLALSIVEERPDVQATGVDLAPSQVSRASRRAKGREDRLRFVEGSALALPFEDASFDSVVSTLSLKHWESQEAGLLECARVLKPGGRMFVAEVDRGCKLEEAEALIWQSRIPWPLRSASVAMYRTWIVGRSLDVAEARALASKLPLASQEVRRLPGSLAFVIQGVK